MRGAGLRYPELEAAGVDRLGQGGRSRAGVQVAKRLLEAGKVAWIQNTTEQERAPWENFLQRRTVGMETKGARRFTLCTCISDVHMCNRSCLLWCERQ